MNRQWLWRVVAIGVATILMAALPQVDQAFAKTPSGGRNEDATLTVSVCATSYASSPQSGSALSRARVSIPKQLARSMSLYEDSKGKLAPLLGPKGWRCTVSVGEDGSTTLSLHPAKAARGEAILASDDGACQGCIADAVCPYFINAQNQIGYTGMNCNATKPNDEVDDYVEGSSSASHGIVRTFDPATQMHSYAVYGVVRYDDVRGAGAEDAREQCTLPKSKASWCSAIINAFVTKNWGYYTLKPIVVPSTTTTIAPQVAGVGAAIDLNDQSGNALTATLDALVPDSVDLAALGDCVEQGETAVAAVIHLTNDGSTVLTSSEATNGAVLVDADSTPIDPTGCGVGHDSSDATPACSTSSISLDLAPGNSGTVCPIFVLPSGTTITQVQYDASDAFPVFGTIGNDAIWYTTLSAP